MKVLILVRHAKSDWGNPGLNDIDRPLNERGKRDAPMMAQRMLDRKIKIDRFVSSPAKRAARTARAFFEAYDAKKKQLQFTEDLYLASPSAFYDVVEGLNDKDDTVALFSHNEGITEFANMLTDARVENIPTSGVFAVKADTDSWSGFREAKKEFFFFDYPKASA